jgi:hypothetical protein
MKDVLICDKLGGVDKKRYNSKISEWGNLILVISIAYNRRTQCELKYLSSIGKEIKRDSRSSDERSGNSSNLLYVRCRSLYERGCRIYI